jgi:hypothetical protein
MAASSQALPTEPLYPVKLATEQVRVALSVSDTQKAQVETELANIRAAELEAMANSGKTDEAAKAVDRYNDQFQKAVGAIIKAGGTEPQPPVYIPATETTPPVVTTTPPVVTTPPATTMPPVVTAPPAITTASENTTPPEVSTSSDNTTPQTTEQLPQTTEQLPPTTEQLPPTTEQLPPTTTTPDKSKATKADNMIKSLKNSTSKSITALNDAKDKASKDDKNDWQNAIDTISKKSQAKSSTTKDTTSQSDNVTSNQENSGAGVTSQTTVQSDNNTAPSPASPSRDKPSSSNRRGTSR